MSLWEKMKSGASKTKLRGEVALIEREIKTRKQKFGVDLYDLMSSQKSRTAGIIASNEVRLQEPFERAKAEIESMLVEKNSHQQEKEIIQVNKDRALPASNAKEHMEKAGKWVTQTGTEGKLQAQIILLERKIKLRKEAFGIEAFDLLEGKPSGEKPNLKSKMSNQLSQYSERSKKIEDVIEVAQKDVDLSRRKIEVKKQEIEDCDM